MNLVVIGCLLEEIIVSCGGTLIKNVQNRAKTSIILVNNQTNSIKKNTLKKRIEKMGITINIIKDFNFFATTQNNVKLIYDAIEKSNPDTIIIPHNKSKKKETRIVGASSILAGRQIRNILMYETESRFNQIPTVIQNIEKVNKFKMQLVKIISRNHKNMFHLFLTKSEKIIKKYELAQKTIEPYHSFRLVLELD